MRTAAGVDQLRRYTDLLAAPLNGALPMPVGVVGTPGGGDRAKMEEQPHAQALAYAPVAPVWSENQEERTIVPITSDAER